MRTKATDRPVLVPVRIENVEPPFGFSRLHAAPLIDWDGSPLRASFGTGWARLPRSYVQ